MIRLLFWIALFVLAYWLWRKATRPERPSAPLDQDAVPMVRCAHCGVHVPRTQALQQEERWYCSRAHLEKDSSNRAG